MSHMTLEQLLCWKHSILGSDVPLAMFLYNWLNFTCIGLIVRSIISGHACDQFQNAYQKNIIWHCIEPSLTLPKNSLILIIDDPLVWWLAFAFFDEMRISDLFWTDWLKTIIFGRHLFAIFRSAGPPQLVSFHCLWKHTIRFLWPSL